MLKVFQLTKSFKDRKLLQNVSFEIPIGNIAVLLGPSGSGKSTLLRCLNFLEKAEKGHIHLNEFVAQHGEETLYSSQQIHSLRKQMGMVFQRFHLWPHMRVMDNLLEAPRALLQKEEAILHKEAHTILKRVGLLDKAGYYPSQLSGGEQQRIAIARAWMMHPKFMLFDEPTASLDPENVSLLIDIIKELSANGQTLLISTHEVNFAKAVASQVLFLDGGKLVEQGERSILFHPQTKRFQAFLTSSSA